MVVHICPLQNHTGLSWWNLLVPTAHEGLRVLAKCEVGAFATKAAALPELHKQKGWETATIDFLH
jgi:hypothetical protein